MELVSRLVELVSLNTDKRIVLLRHREVLQWIVGDLTFLPAIETKNKTRDTLNYKKLEDTWGQTIFKQKRPDLKLHKQWTNRFGEYVCEEILILMGKNIFKPSVKDHFQPDIEDDTTVWEVKTGTYYTTGTAGEKILGCPFKYAEIPDLYTKPLRILCVGGAEKISRECYGNLEGAKCNAKKKVFLNFFKEHKIEYIGATDLFKEFMDSKSTLHSS